MRPLGFCRYLERYEWRPYVITTTPESVYPPHAVDPQLLSKLPTTVKVERVPYVNPLHRVLAIRDNFRRTIQERFGGRSHVSEKVRALNAARADEKYTRPDWKDVILDWAFCFPDPQCAWLERAVSHAKQLPPERTPQAVFATGGPWTSLLA